MQPLRHIHHALVDLRLGFPVVIAGLEVVVAEAAGTKRIVPEVRESATLSEREIVVLELAKRAGILPELWVKETNEAGLKLEDVKAFLNASPQLKQVTPKPVALPIEAHENTRILGFEDGGLTHFALLIGEAEKAAAPLCRVHSSCITGDVLASLRCDCGTQLKEALERMAKAGAGVLLYLNQEGRGIGLAHKLRAYQLQSEGLDTVDANEALGFEADERDFSIAGAMLKMLGINAVTLLTNNPDKGAALEACGVRIAKTETLHTAHNPHNHDYVQTKIERFGHKA